MTDTLDVDGKTIQYYESCKNCDGDVVEFTLHFTDGTDLVIRPSCYNYGPQELYIDYR